MGLNDRITDCEPHSHPLGFRREEAVKDTISICRVKTNAGIRHVDHDVALIVELRPNRQLAGAIHDGAHRVDAIHDEVENDLLQLNAVGHDHRKVWMQLRQDRDAVSMQLITGKRKHFRDRAVDIPLPRSGAEFFDIARMRLSTSLARLPSRTISPTVC
jgi:hypothetical protein